MIDLSVVRSREHICMQVADSLVARIEVGEFKDRLPGARALAEEYGVAYQTMLRAMRCLRERGLVVIRPGRGTFTIDLGGPGAVSRSTASAHHRRPHHSMAVGRRNLGWMTAQPAEDPGDPVVILRNLPERERDEFLRQYHHAVDAAHDPAGYRHLRRLLHAWSLTAIAAEQSGYYEEIEAARTGTATTVPVTDVIPDWPERVAAARSRH
jgi:DNA-binding transcriptional MocR family regulator